MDKLTELQLRIDKLPPNIKWRAEQHYIEATKINDSNPSNWLEHMIKLIKIIKDNGV